MSAVTWTSETLELFTAMQWDWVNQAWLYLIAEMTPDGSWDWAAWSSDDTCRSLHGVACNRDAAMANAEQGVASIKSVRVLAAA